MEVVGDYVSNDFLDCLVPPSCSLLFKLFPHLIGYGQHDSLHMYSYTSMCKWIYIIFGICRIVFHCISGYVFILLYRGPCLLVCNVRFEIEGMSNGI